ncbi:hypothetical protein D3C71_1215130 [compost metagenome]
MVSIRPIMSPSAVCVASCILAANSAAAVTGMRSWMPRYAADSPRPPRMALDAMPWRRSMVIMSMNSAVVPGSLSPRRVARSTICSNSGPTSPALPIMDARSCVSDTSAGMKAPTTERSGPAILLPPAIRAALPAAIMPVCIISLPWRLRSSASLRCCSPLALSLAVCWSMVELAAAISVRRRCEWLARSRVLIPAADSLARRFCSFTCWVSC